MLKDKPIDISETNMALFGTPLEKEIKKAAAQGEPAWTHAGKEVGTQIWRIEKFLVKDWPKDQEGKFFDGDSYIVLKTTKVEEKFVWDVHFWLGTYTTQDEAGTAAYKTVELDDFLDGYPVQHREVQGHESDMFLSYFPQGLEILKGGVDTGFNTVTAAEHRTRLLQLKGKLKNVVAREVPLESASLNSGDVFLLDNNLEIWVFIGKQAGIAEKTKGAQMAQALDDERGSKVTVHTIGEYEMDSTAENVEKFWELLGGRVSSIKTAEEGGSDAAVKANQRMLKVSDESGSLLMTDVDFGRASLKSQDCFIIDVGSETFVWIGSGASENERKSALSFGQKYLTTHGRPAWTPLTRVMEGGENELLLSYFK